MALGLCKVRDLVPQGCNGRWGHAVGADFGFTLYDQAGGVGTLVEVRAWVTTAAGVTTESVVWTGGAFVAPWNGAASAYNPATGVGLIDHAVGFADGDSIRFRVRATDAGADDSYCSWYVGIGTPPNTRQIPEVGDLMRAVGTNDLVLVDALVGAAGSVHYQCSPCDRNKAGVYLLTADQLESVPSRVLPTNVQITE